MQSFSELTRLSRGIERVERLSRVRRVGHGISVRKLVLFQFQARARPSTGRRETSSSTRESELRLERKGSLLLAKSLSI